MNINGKVLFINLRFSELIYKKRNHIMGGIGSGRKVSEYRKQTVENSMSIDSRDLTYEGLLDHWKPNGTIIWSSLSSEDHKAAIKYNVIRQRQNSYFLNLSFRKKISEDWQQINQTIAITPTYPKFGGIIYWFHCPLTIDGLSCNRRVAKLYLPNGELYFGCRYCHNLTYRFCQESHRHDRHSLMHEVDLARKAMTGHISKSFFNT